MPTRPDPRLLVPQPRHARVLDAAWSPLGRPAQGPARGQMLGPLRAVGLDLAGGPAAVRLGRALARLGWDAKDAAEKAIGDERDNADIVLRLVPDGEVDPESYDLRVAGDGVRLRAPTPRGLAHGVSTLVQWLRLHGDDPCEGVVGLEIRDRPDFAHRGLLLDVSRNRVPTMDELERLVDLMASLKLNQLQLYMEHTFAYAGHETVWRGYDPLTPEEIRRLDAYAAARHVELVPHQNSFGHMHRWLVHEPYRRLAECPGGVDHPFAPDPEPFSLCPIDPGSLELLRDLYEQLLPGFRSKLFATGLDETLDLGLGRSKEACAERGKERVYLDFLRQVHALAADHGRRMLFWGDIVLEHPEVIADLPPDVVALAWGYEANHPWNEVCARFAAAGLEFWVCPGTSAWNSLTGRTANLLANVAEAAAAGLAHGARGVLVTDWGDHGHLQPPISGLPGLVAGAARAWNAAADFDQDLLADWLDLHVFGSAEAPDESSLGSILLDLGAVHERTGASALNGSPLFFVLMKATLPSAERRGEGMTLAGLAAARERLEELSSALRSLCELRPDDVEITQWTSELLWCADVLRFAADLAEARWDDPDEPLERLEDAARTTLAARFDALLERLGPLWRARSRPGGLEATRALWRRALRGLW